MKDPFDPRNVLTARDLIDLECEDRWSDAAVDRLWAAVHKEPEPEPEQRGLQVLMHQTCPSCHEDRVGAASSGEWVCCSPACRAGGFQWEQERLACERPPLPARACCWFCLAVGLLLGVLMANVERG